MPAVVCGIGIVRYDMAGVERRRFYYMGVMYGMAWDVLNRNLYFHRGFD